MGGAVFRLLSSSTIIAAISSLVNLLVLQPIEVAVAVAVVA
jgi:hypothetical protein